MMDCDAGELQRKLEVLNAVMASDPAPAAFGAPGAAGGGGGGGGGGSGGRPLHQLQQICTPNHDTHS